MDPIGPELESTLRRFTELLTERAVALGFVAERDAARIWDRHVLDSMRVVPLIPPTAADAVDIGSGAGLPGIVVAAARPDLRTVLLESQRKRAAFLEYAAAELSLSNAVVVHGRAENATVSADVAFARAVGSASAVWRLAQRLLRPGGALLYFAGRTWSPHEHGGLGHDAVAVAVAAPLLVPDQPTSVDVGPIVMISARDT